MGTLYLMRHGRTPPSTFKRILGHLNVPISDEMRFTVAQMAQRLAPHESAWEAIYASDLIRAVQTAQVIQQVLPQEVPVQATAVLRETDFGVLTGMQKAAVVLTHPKYKKDPHYVHPGGESYAEMYARLVPFLEELMKKHKSVIVVTHSGCIRAAYAHFGGEPFSSVLQMPIPEDGVLRCSNERGIVERDLIRI